MHEDELQRLMLAGLDGDTRAYAAALSCCATLLRSYYARRLRDREADIEDLVQETLIAMHARRASYVPSAPFTAWLRAIARYKMVDLLRREARHRSVPIDEAATVAGDDGFVPALAAIDLARLLEQLPPAQADAIRMTKLGGLSGREAAGRSGRSEGSIKVEVHRGLRRMTAMLRSDKT